MKWIKFYVCCCFIFVILVFVNQSISLAYSVSDFNTNLASIVNNAPSSQNNMKSAINVLLNNNANYNNNITTIGMENYDYVLASYVISSSSRSHFDIIMTNEPIEINIQDFYVTFTNIPTNYVVYRFDIVKFSGQYGGVSYEGNVTSSVTITNSYFRRMPTDNTTRNLLVFNVYNLNNPNDLEYLGNWTSPEYFFINLNTNSNTQYVNINTDTGNTLTQVPIIYTNNFGTLEDNKYIYYLNDVLGFWFYNGSSWTYKQIYNRSKEMVLLTNNKYMTFSYFNDYEEVNLSLTDLVTYTNVVYYYNVTNAQFESANAYFIIGDSFTSISNNTIDTSSLPSDYNQQWKDLDTIINDNENTQQIIDNINDGQQVDSILDEFLIVSGDDFAESLGYSPHANSYADFIYQLIDDICDTLYDSGDVYFDYQLHGGPVYRIYSSNIYLPNGVLKTFISSALVFGAIFILYMHFKIVIDAVNSADLGVLLNYDSADINIYKL